MGCFRNWRDVEIFYEGSMCLRSEELKIIRIYQRPQEDDLGRVSDLRGGRRRQEDRAQVPTGGQEYFFTDEFARVHVFAEQTNHAEGCLYCIQVRVIVDTNIFMPFLADNYFDL
jgi:hypothetical protein